MRDSAAEPPILNRIRNTSAFLRKLSLNAEKNWHQNSGAKRRDSSRGLDAAGDGSVMGPSLCQKRAAETSLLRCDRRTVPLIELLKIIGAIHGEDVMSMGSAAPAGAVDNVVARIERLPTSWWHVKTRIIVGVATFFDAFDAIAIATVLPVLVPMWKLTGPDIGFMISAGYVGQLIGALAVRLDRRTLRPHAGDDRLDRGVRGDEPRLRLRLGLQLAALVPHAARHRPRRRGAGRRDLHQRADAGEEPRPLRAAVRAGVSDRARGGEPDFALGGADISAGNGCSTSARCPRSWRWSCARCCRSRRAGSPCTAATPRRTPRCR